MHCAGVASQRGARVVLIDHAQRIGEKIRISGGGRCNFTNLQGDRPDRYSGEDPRFVRSALRAYTPQRFIELVRRYGIDYHEKHKGQLFCDKSSEQIIAMLRAETELGGVHWRTGCTVQSVEREQAGGFVMQTSDASLRADALVVATGGLSVPKIGASDYGLRLARRFGHAVIEPRPALVPLTFEAARWQPFSQLAGIALEVRISTPEQAGSPGFDEDLLFTHRGLSGPAILQASTFWHGGEPIEIDLAPGPQLDADLEQARSQGRQQLAGVLAQQMPKRLAGEWLAHLARSMPRLHAEARVAELGKKDLAGLTESVHRWRLQPAGTEGYRKAEVTAGGVSTDGIDPRTMQSRTVPGLYFIGEVLDVTGWLGGYNFQWAWSSAYAAAMSLTRTR